jgi:hypothetical protein
MRSILPTVYSGGSHLSTNFLLVDLSVHIFQIPENLKLNLLVVDLSVRIF